MYIEHRRSNIGSRSSFAAAGKKKAGNLADSGECNAGLAQRRITNSIHREGSALRSHNT